MHLSTTETREARLIDENIKNAFRLLSADKRLTEKSEYFFSDVLHPMFNCVLATNALPNELELIIKAIRDEYTQKSRAHTWWVSEYTVPNDLANYLIKMRYVQWASFMGMHAGSDSISLHKQVNSKILIRQVTTLQEMDMWIIPIQKGTMFSDAVSSAFLNCNKLFFKDQHLVHFIAYYEDNPVGSASIFFDNESAGLYNGSVVPEFRRLGVITHLGMDMIAEIKRRGYKDIVMQGGEFVRDLGIEMGFKEYINYQTYLFQA